MARQSRFRRWSPGVPGIALSEVATLLRAPLMKDEGGAGGACYKVLSITDFPDYGNTAVPAKEVRIRQNLPKAEKYHLEPYDVLISIVGTIGKIIMVPGDMDGNWIPTSNMLIIRFREQKAENAVAFVLFMKSTHGQNILKRLTHGVKIPMISKKAFAKILVPVLSSDIRRLAKSTLMREERLYQKIEEIVNSIREVRAEYLAVSDS